MPPLRAVAGAVQRSRQRKVAAQASPSGEDDLANTSAGEVRQNFWSAAALQHSGTSRRMLSRRMTCLRQPRAVPRKARKLTAHLIAYPSLF